MRKMREEEADEDLLKGEALKEYLEFCFDSFFVFFKSNVKTLLNYSVLFSLKSGGNCNFKI